MATQDKKLYPIDQNLYRFNIMYQLRQIKANRSLLYKESEKQVLETLLENCKDVDGNKLRPIMDNIFNRSLQSIPPKPTITINRISNTKTLNESTALTSEATDLLSEATTQSSKATDLSSNTTLPSEAAALTLETPTTSIAKDVAQNSDTSTGHTQNIDVKQSEIYPSVIERQLFDPKMSKVSVKIKRRRNLKPKAALSYKAALDKEHNSSMENLAHQRIWVKRRKANKRSYK